MHSIHPTLHDLARTTAPATRHLFPARLGARARRDLALVRLGSATVRVGLRLTAAGRAGALPHSGAPPSPVA